MSKLIVYGSYIGALVDCAPLNLTQIKWIRQANMGTYPNGTPDAPVALSGVAASLAGVGVTADDTRWWMYDNEIFPQSWYYTDGLPGIGNGVTWINGYDTGLAAGPYKTAAQSALTALFADVYAYAPNIAFGMYLHPNRIPYSLARIEGAFTEPVAFAGAAVDLAWYFSLLSANGGKVFAWLYIKANIGTPDGISTATYERTYNYAFNNAKYYLSIASLYGMGNDDVVFHTWHFTETGDRPTAETLLAIKAGLEDAGAMHWVVAMGSAVNQASLDSANAYLADIVAPLFETEGDGDGDDGGGDDGGEVEVPEADDDCNCAARWLVLPEVRFTDCNPAPDFHRVRAPFLVVELFNDTIDEAWELEDFQIDVLSGQLTRAPRRPALVPAAPTPGMPPDDQGESPPVFPIAPPPAWLVSESMDVPDMSGSFTFVGVSVAPTGGGGFHPTPGLPQVNFVTVTNFVLNNGYSNEDSEDYSGDSTTMAVAAAAKSGSGVTTIMPGPTAANPFIVVDQD